MRSFLRESVRALLIDADGKILLTRVTPLDTGATRDLWVTPGGRLKDGETVPGALNRELAEELAETRYEIGPEVWLGDEIVNWNGTHVHLREHFFLVSVRVAQYTFHDQEEAATTHELKWWTGADIAASDAQFVPYEMASLLTGLLEETPTHCKHVQLERPI